MKIGVIGASGYSGEVLLQILARHPKVNDVVVASRSYGGQFIDTVMPSLRGLYPGNRFVDSDVNKLVEDSSIDAWFLALPHGVSAEFALPLINRGRVVIDLSADFRLFDTELYESYYGSIHSGGDWLEKVPYVIPELADESWKDASLIAVPGCYPTSILLPLLPLLSASVIDPTSIVINSVSGVSGAGKKSDNFYSYCERNESVKAYGMSKHRHLAEIEEQIQFVTKSSQAIQFTPHLVPMKRGISSTIVVPAKATLEEIYDVWEQKYDRSTFVQVLKSGESPDTQNVVGTNRAEFSAVLDPRTQNLIITSAIDNLMKGASGQAVQIMNLKFGYDEKEGLI